MNSKKLTAAQNKNMTNAEAKLPQGWSYGLQDECFGEGKYRDVATTGSVWGVVVNDAEGNVIGNVSKPNGDHLAAGTDCEESLRPAVRLALNRAAAAMWHKQPVWA